MASVQRTPERARIIELTSAIKQENNVDPDHQIMSGLTLIKISGPAPAKWSRTVLECSKIILEFSRTMF